MSTIATRSTVQVAAYVEPSEARRFDAAAKVAGVNRSEALRVAMADFADAVTRSLHDERQGSSLPPSDPAAGGRSRDGEP